MKPIELARRYMEVFYHTGEFESLHDIFAEELQFQGPWYRFENSKDYIKSLQQSPPVDCHYEMIEEFENAESVCFIYQFIGHHGETAMCQTFRVSQGRITQIRLIFDSARIL